MKFFCAIILVSMGLATAATGQETGQWQVTQLKGTRFGMVDLYLDAGDQPLAAYQIDFRVRKGEATIVGIEGGEHEAFQNPPYYDPKAIQRERVILAAFSTAPTVKLPSGQTRVARLHLQIRGSQPLKYDLKLQAAANADGQNISATTSSKTKAPL
jgi:hypothetical protein